MCDLPSLFSILKINHSLKNLNLFTAAWILCWYPCCMLFHLSVMTWSYFVCKCHNKLVCSKHLISHKNCFNFIYCWFICMLCSYFMSCKMNHSVCKSQSENLCDYFFISFWTLILWNACFVHDPQCLKSKSLKW